MTHLPPNFDFVLQLIQQPDFSIPHDGDFNFSLIALQAVV